jgi:hypothetical protein
MSERALSHSLPQVLHMGPGPTKCLSGHLHARSVARASLPGDVSSAQLQIYIRDSINNA